MPFTGINYNAGTDASPSALDAGRSGNKDQINSFYWIRRAIIDARKDQYFMPLASVKAMPKHYGKKAVVNQYVPLLDDRNANDQGIDANGVKIANGNLYGSSRDIGSIKKNIPSLTENGGRVNRVGFTRLVREGELQKMGFFYELTQEALDFDSDPELKEHLSRELMNGATQITEANLQIDLLEAADTEVYPGGYASPDELDFGTPTAEGAAQGAVTYDEIERLDMMLTEQRTPYKTSVITGSRYTDTRVINSARVMYIGPDLVRQIKRIKDPFGNQAFISVEHYADAGTVMNGEIGTLGSFRIILVPEMLHWAAEGAATGGDDKGYMASDDASNTEKFDVFPMLVVGDESFTTLGFQTNGKSVNFTVITKMPGTETADYNDPYGELGFSSIKWYTGTLIMRPERIGMLKTLAER